MAGQTIRRASFRVVFGEGGERWSLGDPGHELVSNAQWNARYNSSEHSKVLVLAELVSDLYYLVHTCPTTKLACQKLAALRAAVRKLEASEE